MKITELAAIGASEIMASPGYTFQFRVVLKYICCGANKLPEPKLHEISSLVEKDNGDSQYYTRFPGDLRELGNRIMPTLNSLVATAKADCANRAKSQGGM